MSRGYGTLATVTDVDPSTPMPRDAGAPTLTADDLVRATGGRLLNRSDRAIRGAAVDSRLVGRQQLFVALPGERTDGHAYLAEAVERGASALLVTRSPAAPTSLGDVTVVRVADAEAALGAVAADWRQRFDPVVVGITGSIAKTSTKEAVAAVLGATRHVLKSEGNQNNEIGLPLTLLRLGPEHDAAVLEMGMYLSGEIADLAAMARPSIGVVTAVQAVHLSRIGSLEAIEQAKGELLEALPASGTAVLNEDDPIVARMDRRTAADVVRYGFAETADVRAIDVESRGLDGMRFRLRTRAGDRSVSIPSLGRLSVHNAAAAAAVGLAAGLDLDQVASALAGGWAAPHRVEVVRLGSMSIVDDSYNASPGLHDGRDRGARRAARPTRRRARRDARTRRRARVGSPGGRRCRRAGGRPAHRRRARCRGHRRRRAGGRPRSVTHPPRRRRGWRARRAATPVARRRRGARQGVPRDRPRCAGRRVALGSRRIPMTVELIQGLLLAFALIVILMPPYIRLLQALGFGKRIRTEGPESHYVKEGTPTMGGLLIVIVVLGIYFFLREPDAATFAPLAALAGVGLLGAFDDYLNARTGEGIRARQKLIWLTVVAFVAAWQIQQTYAITAIAVPFVGAVQIAPWLYVLFAAFAIIAAANGVNLTDGLDGLSGGTLAIAFVAYMLIALLNQPTQENLALLCALIIGALLGFLWFNVHPAQIFIGDSGALALGATLAVTALITGQILVLPLIGIIFVLETGSVILQVGYFRLTGGKRLFRMSPIHHHFELGGWDEEKITIRFWIVGILAALLGVTLFLATQTDRFA